MAKHFLFKCGKCYHRELAVIPYDIVDTKMIYGYTPEEEEFMADYKCPNCKK